MEPTLSESIRVNQEDDDRDHHETAFIDSTVQEKNVTYPTDAKLHKKDAVNALLAAAAYNFKRAMRLLGALVEKFSETLYWKNVSLAYTF